MPVARYFLYVGAVLIALLFAVDALTPKEPVPVSTAAAAASTSASVDNPTLRIRSDHKWPERVVYDTSLPTIVPPQPEIAAVVPAPAEEISAKSRVRESFAQFRPADEPKVQAKPLPKRKIAKHRAAPPVMRVAQEPYSGFFGRNFW